MERISIQNYQHQDSHFPVDKSKRVKGYRSKIAGTSHTGKAENILQGSRVVSDISAKSVDRHLVSLIAPESYEAEQYRILRYAIESLPTTDAGSIIGITSPLAGDGKSTTSINLSGALAQDASTSVLLIEVDLRCPGNWLEQLGVTKTSGLGLVDAILDPSICLPDIIYHFQQFNLSVLPAGKRYSAPYEALKSPRFGELLVQARENFDYVILDIPPVVTVPDYQLLRKWVDGFVIVVAAGRTPRDAVKETLISMENDNVLGMVLNGYDRSAMRYYDTGYNHPGTKN